MIKPTDVTPHLRIEVYASSCLLSAKETHKINYDTSRKTSNLDHFVGCLFYEIRNIVIS